jgi:hypothetical protein
MKQSNILYKNKSLTKIRKRLTKLEQNSFVLTQILKEIIIGLSLGDLNIRKQVANAQLRFEQGAENKDYLLHLYDLFKDYCSSDPKVRGH